jgi:UV damage endonuclease UvdE
VKRLGFCCKWIDHLGQVNGIGINDTAKQFNSRTTTVSWLNRQSREVAEQRLWELMIHNINSVKLLVERVGGMDDKLRMVRISSDLLPVYTHNDFKYFWNQTDVRDYASRHFEEVGSLARNLGVRLSFHPGQYNSISSDNPDIVSNSVEDLEYHADMARWMGYGKTFQDFKINVHLSGRNGVDGFPSVWNRISVELRNCLTLENDEFQKGLDDLLFLSDKVAIVLDIHHHLIRDGEYIQVNDERIKKIIDSWRGVRPVIHYSQSRSDIISQFNQVLPSFDDMLSVSTKSKLRAHSDFYDNKFINEWALTHLSWADVMCEAKGKNLAVARLINDHPSFV